ncbi:ComEC/Rec2 family competence protein [Vreelandella sp. H-I2]
MEFFEIDFLPVNSTKSGDAITARYVNEDGETVIHVIDSGYQHTGESVIEHILKYYGENVVIDHMVLTHHDGDHAGGLREVLSKIEVRNLWMLKPWDYSNEIIHRFSRFSNHENLSKRLKEKFPNIKFLEDIANDMGVPIRTPFAGAEIGSFKVLAPSKELYLDLVVESERSPDVKQERVVANEERGFLKGVYDALKLKLSEWGEEIFSNELTSCENEMSIVQAAVICEKSILLTGDAGRRSLDESINNFYMSGIELPGVDFVQVPHHGSRRNVSSEILDKILGEKKALHEADDKSFVAIISASKEDEKHPRKSVIRAFHHRGAKVITTENGVVQINRNAPERAGWSPVDGVPYPTEQESD